MPNFKNVVHFSSKGGENHLFVNGRDIVDNVSAAGFQITLDRDTMKPVLHVTFPVDELTFDADGVLIVEEKA